jgi:hypothetical protein
MEIPLVACGFAWRRRIGHRQGMSATVDWISHEPFCSPVGWQRPGHAKCYHRSIFRGRPGPATKVCLSISTSHPSRVGNEASAALRIGVLILPFVPAPILKIVSAAGCVR